MVITNVDWSYFIETLDCLSLALGYAPGGKSPYFPSVAPAGKPNHYLELTKHSVDAC